MSHRERSVLLATLLLISLPTGLVTASPPQSGTEENGLSQNESATLWSRDTDSYQNQTEYRESNGERRTLAEQIANGTDTTFKSPPETASTWTRYDFQDLDPGNATTSVYPSHASPEDGRFIVDAHATIFAIQPSTRGHLETDEQPLYIAPNGTLRGFVDYRIQTSDGSDAGNTTSDWSLRSHEISEIRLKNDGKIINETNGSHTPSIDYSVKDDWNTTLTLEAEISVQVGKTTRYKTETQNVSDSIDVEVYNLSASPYYAEYPDGDAGVAIFQSRPWQGYSLTDDGNASVRGVWRFYTARNTDWDTLVRSNQSGSTSIESDAVPVFVHAYPSRIGPRAEPVRGGPELIETWGVDRPSPRETIGENINIEVVNQSYTTTHGVAVRTETVDRDVLDIAGIVHGVNATISEPDFWEDRQLRESNLSVEVVQQNGTQATLQIELRNNETTAPIVLENQPRWYPIGGQSRSGYITIGDRRVETNASGVATVTVDEPGIYTARYHPGSWLRHDPAYVRDTATVRWHPLGSSERLFALLFEVVWQLFPFIVMFYAGNRLLRMFGPDEFFNTNT